MADKDDTKKQQDSKAEKNDTDKKASGSGILLWIIMAVVVVVCAGAGLGLGRLFAGLGSAKTTEPLQEDTPAQPEQTTAVRQAPESQSTWYYDLEPVVANLDEPGVMRYVRAVITLEISSELEQEKGYAFFQEKNPVLINWLTIYLKGLSLEDTRGGRNMRRIQSEILDAFNEKLFPDSRPRIKHILFKEFAIQ